MYLLLLIIYFNVETKAIKLKIVVNFAKAFGVSTEYLLDDGEESEVSAYKTISTAIARKGGELTPEEKNDLIALLLGSKADV